MFGWRVSARAIFTLLTTAMTMLAVILIVAIVRGALSSSAPDAAAETAAAVWFVGSFIVVITALASWFLGGALVRPLSDMRRDLTLSARTRALAESAGIEPAEVHSLRAAILAVLTEAEQRVRAAETEQQRLLHLFEAITEGIVQIGAGARIRHANAAARLLLGLPPNAEGQTAAALIRNLELRELLERAASGASVMPVEVVINGKQLLITPQPLPARRGEEAGSVITIVELTELRRLESVRRDFVANVSHELKTPLTSIRGYTETLISDDMPREVQLQFLEVISKNASRINRIVNELLDLSRLQSGGWQPDLQIVDAAELARDVWSACEDAARKKDIRFAVTGGPATVLADPDGLRQVLSNLFDNAIRYTQTRGHVQVGVRRCSSHVVEIEVKDTGIGIPQDALPRIFERFFRVDPARSREQGGTGLGLAIVKHLVERMSGEVIATSELGKGTVVRVRLPAAGE